MNNGRVNLSAAATSRLPAELGTMDAVPGFSFRTSTAQSEADDAIRGNMQANTLNQAFFSPANVGIRREVYDRSGGEFLIDPQSADELMIVMRAMYLQYGKNLPTDVAGQIAELNQLVADWCVPKIVAECSMHRTYLKDIQQLPVPMAHPIMLTKTGSKSASFERFF
jgi:hypothetical protein